MKAQKLFFQVVITAILSTLAAGCEKDANDPDPNSQTDSLYRISRIEGDENYTFTYDENNLLVKVSEGYLDYDAIEYDADQKPILIRHFSRMNSSYINYANSNIEWNSEGYNIISDWGAGNHLYKYKTDGGNKLEMFYDIYLDFNDSAYVFYRWQGSQNFVIEQEAVDGEQSIDSVRCGNESNPFRDMNVAVYSGLKILSYPFCYFPPCDNNIIEKKTYYIIDGQPKYISTETFSYLFDENNNASSLDFTVVYNDGTNYSYSYTYYFEAYPE